MNDFCQRQNFFYLAKCPDMLRSPPTSSGTQQLFLRWHSDRGVKLDDSPPSHAQAKNACSFNTIPSHASMACCLIKYLYNFIFVFSFTLQVIYRVSKQRPVLTPASQSIRATKLLICVWQIADSYISRHYDSTVGFSLYLERKSRCIWCSAVFVSSRLPFRILYLIPVIMMWFFPVPPNFK